VKNQAPKALAMHVADALFALAALAVLEIVVVGALSWSRFAGPYELGRSMRRLLPLSVAAAVPCAAIAGALAALLVRGGERGARVALAGLAAAFGGSIAAGVSTGRHFEDVALRAAFVAGLAAASGAAAFFGAGALARGLGAARRAPLAIGLAAGVLALEIANALVLPRLYPAFHLGLGALAIGLSGFVPLALRDGEERRAPPFSVPRVTAAALGAVAVIALSPAAARSLALADNIRLIYLERAPLLGHVVRGAAKLAPPRPIDDDAPLAQAQSSHAIHLAGRDILLISIDALRADHVGAYGYVRPTTPHIDDLAKESVVFDAAYTPAPHTSYAVTSLMTGKYMRPLLLQGLGADSETWATHLRRYGFRTAAFYPPAVFFIDAERFGTFSNSFLGFEYRKVEFADPQKRADQVTAYLGRVPAEKRLFLWVHLFEPHEPYEAHPEYPFGDRDVDRYDSEIAAADAGVGRIVEAVRKARPGTVVILTADHGEEFGEHGGRYHGTTVYEEQVRVPLLVSAPGLFAPRRVPQPVQLVDLLPTVLAGLDIPRPARVRGTDLGPLLAGKAPPPGFEDGFAFAETDEQTMLARGSLRLVCARKIGACALHDLTTDPGELRDDSAQKSSGRDALRAELAKIEASHGTFEVAGLRAEGKGWPAALRRGIAGDADAAADVAALLDDADVAIRRKAAEVLFDLKRPETAAALRLAVVRDEDTEVKTRASLALTRLGEGAARTRELLDEPDVPLRRLAALALAEQGETRGEAELIAWWRKAFSKNKAEREPLAESRAREILAALGRIRSKDAVFPLISSLGEVRLRPYIAEALAQIGEDAARPALADQLAEERYQTARVAIVKALLKLGADDELAQPLAKLLGMPDPLPNGLEAAMKAGILQHVGGPRSSDLGRLVRLAKAGAPMRLLIPKTEKHPADRGLRAICRGRTTDGLQGEIRIGRITSFTGAKGRYSSWIPRAAPELDPQQSTVLRIDPGSDPDGMKEVFASLPRTVDLKQGEMGEFVVYATQNVEVVACAVVGLQDELPPPPPEPWTPGPEEDPPAP
jgi:arylsulfatase A-like enzyme